MIETMKVKIHEGKGYFVYGVKPSAEAFYDSDGQIKGWASLFCEWLTELIGIPFKPEFTDTSFNNYYDANINPFSAIDFFPDVNNHFLLTTNNYERQAIVSLVYKAVHNGSLTYLTTLYNQGEKEYLKNKLLMQLSDEERLFIKNNPVIFFAAEFDNYPVSFYNSHEKQLQGIAIDVLHEISDLCGLSFEQINNNYENFSSLLSIVEKGEASFITELIRIPNVSELHEKFIRPKNKLMLDNFALISKLEYPNIKNNDIIHQRIGIEKNTAYEEMFNFLFYKHGMVIQYETFDEAVFDLNHGKIDMIMGSQSLLLMLTNFREQAGFKANLVFDSQYESVFGFNKEQVILCSIFDKALNYINTKEISRQWRWKTYDYRIKIILSQIPWLIGVVFLLFSVLVLIIILYNKNIHEGKRLDALVKKRTFELDKIHIDLLSTAEKAYVANQAKTVFITKMSHEILNPMNMIINSADLALQENNSLSSYEYIKNIKNSGIHLLSIINDILDFSSIETEKLQITSIDYNLSSLLKDVINIIKIHFDSLKHIKFIVNIDSKIPNSLYGDKIRICQILLNILNNAINYTEKGYISFLITGTYSEAKNGEISDNIINLSFEITDTGKGIKPENIDKIFGSLTQADLNKSISMKETRLGLTISKNLAIAMNGDITVSSKYGKGSIFTFSLPQIVREKKQIAFVENFLTKRILVYENREVYSNSILKTMNNLYVLSTFVKTDTEFYKEISTRIYTYIFIAFPLYKNVKNLCTKLDTNSKIILLTLQGDKVNDKSVNIINMPVHAISIADILNEKE